MSFELDVPLDKLKPGQYVCQLNVIDDAAGSFAFPRFAVLVREPPAAPAAAPAAYTNCHAACHTRRESILLRWSVAIASLPQPFRGLIAQRVGSHAGLPTRWLAHRLISLMIATRIIAPANAIRVL